MRNPPFVHEPGRPLVIGHRGCSSRAPENTLASFALLRELGITGAELDVHRCSTGEIVVAHDDDLKRTAGADVRIVDTPLQKLREYDIGSWLDARFASERIPLFSEVLEALGPDMFVDVEIKHYKTRLGRALSGGVEIETVRLIREHGLAGRCIVSSFDPFVVRRVHAIAPDIPVATIYSDDEEMPFFLRRNGGRAISGATVMKPHHAIATREMIARHHRAGRYVLPWTVDDPELARTLADNGVDGIITNRPVEIREALGA